MPPIVTLESQVYADHAQFYVVDDAAEYRAELAWDGAGLERHLGIAAGIVAVGTIGYTFLPVRLEVWDDEPPLELDEWDHVGEASLDVASGRLALHTVEGPVEDVTPLVVDPDTYRVRVSAAGLGDADEMEGGDRYRVQAWPAPSREPEVRKWWAQWDPSGAAPARTTAEGRIIIGAEAEDRRRQLSWLASRGQAHLFRDDDGAYWEASNLRDGRGTPQLEELSEADASSRYGSPDEWACPRPKVPGASTLSATSSRP